MDKRALIVDDEPASLRLLHRFLTDNGYQVQQAVSGQQAMQIMLESAPPLVITDLQMPDMDGFQLCRALREHEGVRFAYIVVVTAFSDTQQLVMAFEAGADDFLAKPINRLELMARLRAGERITRLESDLARRNRDIHRLNAQAAVANQKLELANQRLQEMATTDELTGLINRREALNRLKQLWDTEDRYGPAFAGVMIDVDHFKTFNDTHGHAAGDYVLREVASLLSRHVRSSDIVCRVGGEEFLVLCPHTDLPSAAGCAEKLRLIVAQNALPWQSTTLNVTISLGVAQRTADMSSPDELIRAADKAMYASKLAGRNRVTVASCDRPSATRMTTPSHVHCHTTPQTA